MSMLDERTKALLKIINEKCAQGSYKIISLDEILSLFPKEYGADGDLIRQILSALTVGGYIIVRYDRDGEFCLTPTNKGRLFFETEKSLEDNKKKDYDFLNYFYIFLAVFIGVFFANIFCFLAGVLC